MLHVLATEAPAIAETVKPIMDSIQGAASMSDIVSLVGQAVAFGLPFFLGWFGIRKVVKVATGAIKSGSIRA